MNHTAKHITITGKVQGAFFRKYTKQKADELKVTGWVKNTDNGNVEVFVQGDENRVGAFIQFCWQGSPKAKVENIQVYEAHPDVHLKQFLIER